MKPLKIGFDAKRLFQNFTGLGNYSRELVRNLQRFYPQHEYHLFTPGIKENDETEYFLDTKRFVVHNYQGFIKSYWRYKSIMQYLKKHKIDLFHGLSAELPMGVNKAKIKSVVTIHDVIYKSYPSDFYWWDRSIYNQKTHRACQNADMIITVSKHTKEQLVKYYNIEILKISTLYPIVQSLFVEQEKSSLNSSRSLPDDYYLFIGTISPRKNLRNLLIALKSIPKNQRRPLVIIGSDKNREAKELEYFIRKNFDPSEIYWHHSVNSKDVRFIYKNAQCLIYPSFEEGFGLPVIEALNSGIPVIASNRGAVPEAGGKVVHYINPDRPAEIASAMLGLNKYEQDRISIHLQQFDAEFLSNQLMDLYKKVLNDK